MRYLPHLLVLAAIAVLAVGLWHRQKVDFLRQDFRARGGEIDIPEALYFDSMAASVQIPVLLGWMVFQAGSALAFCWRWNSMGGWPRLVFVALWCVSSFGVFELLTI